MKLKRLIPTNFGHFLAIFSAVGFLGVMLYYLFGVSWLTDNSTGVFLALGGIGFLVISKVFTIGKWARNGIQRNEFSLILGLIFGLSSLIIGILLLLGVAVPVKYYGFIGILAGVPLLYIIVDYIKRRY